MRWSLLAALALPTLALAKPDSLRLAIYVLDAAGNPIPTAVVRHVQEGDRHAVNRQTGGWSADRLYLEGGQELVFERGTRLQFEISAPNYITSQVVYSMRARKNRLKVTLEPMGELIEEEEEDLVIQFFRDRPIENDAGGPTQ